MTRISVARLGFAVGATFSILYMGCAIAMMTLGREGTIIFFNSILHGIDVATILRIEMPLSEMAIGFAEVFILGWMTGATIASFYNLVSKE